MTEYVIRTRSTHAYALVKMVGTKATFEAGEYRPGVISGAELVGYAASESAAVKARARRLGARIVPIIDGRAVVAA